MNLSECGWPRWCAYAAKEIRAAPCSWVASAHKKPCAASTKGRHGGRRPSAPPTRKCWQPWRARAFAYRDEHQLTTGQEIFCRAYFADVIKPQLVPLILNRRARLPFLQDSHIYHAVRMAPEGNKKARYAIIRIPVNASCPRFVEMPSQPGCHDIIFVDDIVRLCLNNIFFMFSYAKISAYTFKVMRDAELSLDDDVSKSLIEKMEEGLEHRLRGRPVRLIYDQAMPADLLALLASKLNLKSGELNPGAAATT